MRGLKTKEFLYINEHGKWCDVDIELSPRKGDVIRHRVNKTFFDVYFYYANLIDYVRILMACVALALIFVNFIFAPKEKELFLSYAIAILLFSSFLLDGVDGKAARYFNQPTVMGCGWNWLADIIAQYCLAVWCLCRMMEYLQRSDANDKWVSRVFVYNFIKKYHYQIRERRKPKLNYFVLPQSK